MPKSKKAKRRQKRSQKQKRLEGFKRKLRQGPLRGEKLVIEPTGHSKMSGVLADFVAPYREWADSEEAYRKLLTVAVMAWNASLLPEDEQQVVIDRILDEGLPAGSQELKAGLEEIAALLIARKKAHFSENRRTIIDFELTDTGTDYHLSVASTLGAAAPGGSDNVPKRN